jgi:hypothetical protein
MESRMSERQYDMLPFRVATLFREQAYDKHIKNIPYHKELMSGLMQSVDKAEKLELSEYQNDTIIKLVEALVKYNNYMLTSAYAVGFIDMCILLKEYGYV